MSADFKPVPRRLLLTLMLLAALAELLLIVVLRPHGGANIVKLELAPSAAAFIDTVQRDWTQDAAGLAPATRPLCGLDLPHSQAPAEAHKGKLRCNLLVDSLGLVPGYVGLLLILTLGCLAPVAPASQRLAWCLPALAAGFADLAENGLTWQALDLLHSAALSEAAVASVRQASQAKWLLLASALAALGHLAWHGAAGRGDTPRRVAAGLCAAGAVALPWGAWVWQPAIGVGMLMMVMALALLAWWQWRSRGRAAAGPIGEGSGSDG
jgi:hypothetical protein